MSAKAVKRAMSDSLPWYLEVFFGTVFFEVNLFSKRGPVSEIAAPSDQDRYAEILKQLRVTEVNLSDAVLAIAKYNAEHKDMRSSVVNGETYYRVGAMTSDPARQALESVRNRVLERRNNILKEYAGLKMKLGRAR
jgi:hypothetical protein